MPAEVIQAKYEMLTDIASRFGQQGEATSQYVVRMRERMSALQDGGWEGQGAQAFFTEVENEVLPALGRLSSALTESRLVTLQIIRILRAAEEEGARLFGRGEATGSSYLYADPASHGAVLGVSNSIEKVTPETESWWNNLRLEKKIDQQIADLKARLQKGIDIQQVEKKLSHIKQKIQHLEQEKASLQAEADLWQNKLMPDWPLALDNDGVPWRVRADDLEDSLDNIDKQINGLQAQQDTLETQQQIHHDLELLKQEKEAIHQRIETDMKKYDGSTYAPGVASIHGKPGQLPVNAPITSNTKVRDPRLYETIINQFAVGHNSRYASDNYTYCNTFAGDVARAMGVPFPQKGEFYGRGNDQATIGFPYLWQYFTDPNAKVKAVNDGWREIRANDLKTLERYVNNGKMAIVINQGHIAVIRPNQKITSFENIHIAQAGAQNRNDILLNQGFGSTQKPRIFVID